MKLGASNKYFYYTRTGNATFTMCPKIIFQEPLRLEEFQEAATEALKLYPELAARTVVKDGKLMAVPGEEPVAFFPEDGKKHQIGGDESNGHLFFIRYGENQASFPCFHGWTDYKGAITYMRTVLWLYAKKIGFSLAEEDEAALLKQIRVSQEDYAGMDEEEMYDPYGKYGRDVTPSYVYDMPQALSVETPRYADDDPYLHRYVLETSISAFLKKGKELGVSAVPYLVNILGGAMVRDFAQGDLPAVIMVPSDCRRLFGSNTLVNFSDGMFFPYYPSYEKMSTQERCAIMKDYLVKQNQKDVFEKVLFDKTNTVKAFEQRDILSPAQPAAPQVRRVTLPVSYIGKTDFGFGLDGMVKDFWFEPMVQTYAVIVYTYRDAMRLYCVQRSDDRRFLDSMQKAFEKEGLPITLTDLGKDLVDHVDLEALRKL